jgi:hypothetical protein
VHFRGRGRPGADLVGPGPTGLLSGGAPAQPGGTRDAGGGGARRARCIARCNDAALRQSRAGK